MRIAIVHDWLTGMRGGEKVLSLLCRMFPQADLLTLLHAPGSCDRHIGRMKIITSCLNDLPAVRSYYRYLLPAMPFAIERMDASAYDLIISSSHCVAKGIIRRPDALHVCYCHTPMRYAWNLGTAYSRRMGLAGLALRAATPYLRAWDRRSASHVDHFIANCRGVANRIRTHYSRSADIVHAPVDASFYTPAAVPREDFYLMVTALVPYKRVDQAIAAFAALRRPLRIIGSGPGLLRLRHNLPSNVQLLGWQDNHVLRDHYRRCRAFVMPGEEDFGITPLEAMACGAPVIAYGAGGAVETVRTCDAISDYDAVHPTGLLYTPQSVDALMAAVQRFEPNAHRFDAAQLAAWAAMFDTDNFIAAFQRSLRPLLAARGIVEPWSNVTTN